MRTIPVSKRRSKIRERDKQGNVVRMPGRPLTGTAGTNGQKKRDKPRQVRADKKRLAVAKEITEHIADLLTGGTAIEDAVASGENFIQTLLKKRPEDSVLIKQAGTLADKWITEILERTENKLKEIS